MSYVAMGFAFTQTLVKIRTNLPWKCAGMYRKCVEDCNKVFVINCVIPGYFTVWGILKWTSVIAIMGIRRKNPDFYNAERLLRGNCGEFRTAGIFGKDKLCISLGFYNIQTDGGLR